MQAHRNARRRASGVWTAGVPARRSVAMPPTGNRMDTRAGGGARGPDWHGLRRGRGRPRPQRRHAAGRKPHGRAGGRGRPRSSTGMASAADEAVRAPGVAMPPAGNRMGTRAGGGARGPDWQRRHGLAGAQARGVPTVASAAAERRQGSGVWSAGAPARRGRAWRRSADGDVRALSAAVGTPDVTRPPDGGTGQA